MRRTGAYVFAFLLLGFAGYLYYEAPERRSVILTSDVLTTAQPVPGFETGKGPNLSSKYFSPALWQLERVTIVPNAAVGPDGAKTAARMAETNENGRHRMETRVAGATPGAVHTLSFYVKPAERTLIQFEMRDEQPGRDGSARFDLKRKVVVAETGYVRDAGIQELPNGWYRCWAAMPYAKDKAVFAFALMRADGEVVSYKGDRQAGLLIWGVQFEPGDHPGGYSPTPIGDLPLFPESPSTPTATSIATQVTDISKLPPLPSAPSAPDRWDLMEGLSAGAVEGAKPVSGVRILRLVATGQDGRHALSAGFGGLAPGGGYRAIAWVKAEPGVRVMIAARDSVDQQTGKPSNYGVAKIDLSTRTVMSSAGDILASGVDAVEDGWVKLWVDLNNKDGQLFVLIGLLEGLNNQHVFKAAGQEVTFGGFEISPARPVQTSSQADLPTRATSIDELPPVSESSSGPDRWDLIEGLNAEGVKRPAVVLGQRILRLVAVGADGRHALGARFGGLAPGGVYRAIAWVKAEPGVRVMIAARDSVDQQTGRPSNYGVAKIDLSTRTVMSSTGDILASEVDTVEDGWVKLWVDLNSKDGQIFVLIGLLEGLNNQHVFKAGGQEVTFGGFEISPPRQ
jgi:hypothetical protein